MKKYLPRIADKILMEQLDVFGAALIIGPKWCGKTTTAKQFARSYIELSNMDEVDSGIVDTATIRPTSLLPGETPRLFDEWQIAPQIWDAVRSEVDRRGEPGQFILTGSNAVDFSKIRHTGTGRISTIMMYPMTLYESGESNGVISLKEIFDDPAMEIEAESGLSVEELIYAACRGGWPAAITRKQDASQLLVAKSYLKSVCDVDIGAVDKVKRDSRKVSYLMKSYARNISTLASKKTIQKDYSAMADISMGTIDDYLTALEKIFVIEDIVGWNPSIRSVSAMRTGRKRLFIDPSIAVAALGVSSEYLNRDLKTFGLIFENLCIRDLKVYSQAMGGSVSYYRDKYGLEVDAVLHLEDGRYALIEIKLGSKGIEEGANNLLKIRDLIRKHGAEDKQAFVMDPDLMIVLTAGKYAYTRPDGVKVIPIGCLRD